MTRPMEARLATDDVVYALQCLNLSRKEAGAGHFRRAATSAREASRALEAAAKEARKP